MLHRNLNCIYLENLRIRDMDPMSIVLHVDETNIEKVLKLICACHHNTGYELEENDHVFLHFLGLLELESC